MRRYCTLFDSGYLCQGIALYHSLRRWSSVPFQLTILALDRVAVRVLQHLALPNVIVIPLEDLMVEIPRLYDERRLRQWNEFCWMLASVLMSHIIGDDEITYVDADTFFFDDPEICFHEMGSKEIGIVPHRFPLDQQWKEENGQFNVSMVVARGATGRAAIQRWAQQCLDWCYYRVENGKFGDQKYLDKWPTLYEKTLHIFANPCIGVAPWNVSQYSIEHGGVMPGPMIASHPIVFYHFHEFRYVSPTGFFLTNYQISRAVREFIYTPYILALSSVYAQIQSLPA